MLGMGIALFVVVANTLTFQKRVSKKRTNAQIMALVLVLLFIMLGLFFLRLAP
jgi:NADH:ubiquinone oxidoreductase subunit 2 (subunit N)